MSGSQGGAGRNTAPSGRTLVAYLVGFLVAVAVMYLATLLFGIGGVYAAGGIPAASGVLLLLGVVLVPGSGIYAGVKVARYIKHSGASAGAGATEGPSASPGEGGDQGAADRVEEVAGALDGVSQTLSASRAALDRAERYLDHGADRFARRTADRVDRMVYVERILRAAVDGVRERPTAGDRVDRVAASLADAEGVAGYDVERAAELLEEALATAGPLAETLRERARERADRAREADAAGDAERARREYDRAIHLMETAMDLDAAEPVGVESEGGDGDGNGPSADRPPEETPAYGLSDPSQTGAGGTARGLGNPPSETDPESGASDRGDDAGETDPDAERLRRWRSERERADDSPDAGPGRVRDTERV